MTEKKQKRFTVQNIIKGFNIGEDTDLETLQELVEEYGSSAKIKLFISDNGKGMTYGEVENLLNSFYEENEQLKSELCFWKKQAKHCPMRSCNE